MNHTHYSYRDADYRLLTSDNLAAQQEIRRQRTVLEEYITSHPDFRTSLEPLPFSPDAPSIVRRMMVASLLTRTGPMAAVAGAIAEYAARESWKKTGTDAVIDNGGDLFLITSTVLHIAIYAGKESPFNALAYRIEPDLTPLAICSSSGTMGHSLSLGCADLVTVFSRDAALADCTATMTANLIRTADDLKAAVEHACTVPGIMGASAIKDDKIALAGRVGRLVRHTDLRFSEKITYHPLGRPA
ncbi:MAG: UPF0280 family protein [Spirochaetota bacterium]